MIVKQMGAMTQAELRGELQRCGGVPQDEGGKLTAIGEDLKTRSADTASASFLSAAAAPK